VEYFEDPGCPARKTTIERKKERKKEGEKKKVSIRCGGKARKKEGE